MTSDAKIGLLLGLVFIVVIAFIINGLPSFHSDKDSNGLTTRMAGLQNGPPGLGAKERKAQETLNLTDSAKEPPAEQTQPLAANTGDVRSIAPLPTGESVVRDILVGRTPDSSLPPVVQQSDQTKTTVLGPIAAEKTDVNKPSSVKSDSIKPGWPKSHIVSAGDSLATIAKKFYGEQEGNRKVNITRIFEANKNVLKLPEQIYVGQKLVIPALVSPADTGKPASAFSSSVFEKVKSIGQRHIAAEDAKPGQTGSGEYVVVREGDNLWRIAAQNLGDGNRYKEISKLNTDILKDEDTLVIGMRLKLPAR